MSEEQVQVKRPRGRPKKNPDPVVREAKRPMFRFSMDADAYDPSAVDPSLPLHIGPEEIPEGITFMWERISIAGQPDGRNVQLKRQAGWQPVCKGDLDGQFDNRWDHKNDGEQLTYDGTCGLVYRPTAIHKQAQLRDYKKAREAVMIKERQFTDGGMPNVSLDANHPSAVNTNRITKSYERIEIPEK